MPNAFVRNSCLVLSLAACLLDPSSSLQAATGLWIGSSGEQLWNHAENWQEGIIPGSPSTFQSPDRATIGSLQGATTLLLPENWNLQQLEFNSTAHALILGANSLQEGGSIQLSPSAFLTVNANVTAPTIVFKSSITLPTQVAPGSDTSVISNDSPVTLLQFEGPIQLHQQELWLGGAGSSQISGIISGNSFSILRKTDTGIWNLTGQQDLSRIVYVNQGSLLLNSPQGSGTGTASVYVESSGTIGGTGQIHGTTGKELRVSSGGTLMVGNSHGKETGSSLDFGYQAHASTLQIGNNNYFSFQNDGVIQFDLFANDEGLTRTEADRLIFNTVSDVLVLRGTIQIANASGSRYEWQTGEWQLFDISTLQSAGKSLALSSNFQLPDNALRIGYTWDTSSLASTGALKSVAAGNANYWTGAGTSASWIDLDNWSLGVVPDKNYDAIFGQIAAPTTGVIKPTHNTDTRVRNLLFTGEREYDIAISGGVFFFEGNLLHSAGGNQAIRGQVRSIGSAVRILNDSGTLHINQISSNNAVTWTFDGAGDITVGSIGRRFDHNVDVVKEGTNTLTITGYNSISGEAGFTGSGAYVRGKVSLLGGTLRIQDERSLGGESITFRSDQLTFDGGRLVSYGNDVTLSNNNRGVTFGILGASLGAEASRKFTVNAAITGVGGATISGAGDVIFTNANTYQGSTDVVSGKFWVKNSTGSATGSGSVFLRSGAQLGGTGIIAPAQGKVFQSFAGSQLIVGNSHGGTSAEASLLTLGDDDSNASILLAGTLKFDLTAAGNWDDLGSKIYLAPSTNDQLVLLTTGHIDLTQATLELSATNTTGWQDGQQWKLIDWSQSMLSDIQSTGLGLTTSVLGGYNLTTLWSSDGLYVKVVPEPSRSLLALLAVSATLLTYRRRR